MSIWTHVSGVVRIDDIRLLSNGSPKFDKIFGKEWSFDDMWENMPVYGEFEKHPEDFMPYGSEGSLQKSIWVNLQKEDMAAYTVSIFGDLRDYDTPQKIIDWFVDCCNKCMVRQAVITVETEGYEPLNYFYKEGI